LQTVSDECFSAAFRLITIAGNSDYDRLETLITMAWK
jgi:hypothetical protein